MDGVQFGFLDSFLRIQVRIVLVGAMPTDAYRLIRNSFIRLIGAANPIRPRRGEIADYCFSHPLFQLPLGEFSAREILGSEAVIFGLQLKSILTQQ